MTSFGQRMRSAFQGMRERQQARNPTFRGAKSDLTRQALGATRRAGQLGAEAESEFFRRAQEFDPQAAAERSAQGIAGSLSRDLQRNLTFAQGQAVGGGRLDTGFFDEDRGFLFEDFNERLTDAIARQALQAQQLNLSNIQGIGRFGESVSNRFTNLLGGSLDRAQAEENARREGGGLFGKILGGIGGLVLPGIGSKVGEFVGNKITGG